MIGYTCAYLRYYYPKEFITAYLNNANNDDDINMGTALANQLNIQIYSIKFRYSLSEYSCDKTGIYKGIASIKFCNPKIAQELYELRNNTYDSFSDLLVDIDTKTSVNSRQLEILVKLDFFSEFGEPNALLEQIKVFDSVYGKKTAKKKDGQVCIGNYSLPYDSFVSKVVDKTNENYKESEKQIKGFSSLKFIKAVCDEMKYPETTVIDKIKYEMEHLGYISTVNPNENKRHYFVTSLKIGKGLTTADLYEIYSGKTRSIKIWTRSFDANPFSEGDMLSISVIEKKAKQVPSDQISPRTGKKIWVDDLSAPKEAWLKTYKVITEDEDDRLI